MNANIDTPCFIIDEQALKTNIRDLHKALKNTWKNYIIAYSCKTNSLPWVINFLKKEGCYAEVVSDFEYKLSKRIGYTDKTIVFNGPNKGKEIFIEALKNKCILNIDSWREIYWLQELHFEEQIEVGIRVNLDLEKECPGETSVGDEGSRFGFSLENGDLEKAIDIINGLKNIKIVGIHLHHTAKTRSLNVYRALSESACKIKELINYDLDYVDIGGGFFGGMPDKPSYFEYMSLISNILSKKFDCNKTKLIVEPGSAIIASPISFICEVVDVKDTFANRIVTVNGSRTNIDPLMIKNNYFYELISDSQNTLKEQIICGYTCLEYDRLMKIKDNKELKIGDKIRFNKIGAYSIALSPLFIEYFPKVYVKNQDVYKCIRDRWDVDEYIQKSYI